MSQENVNVVRRGNDAFLSGDVQTALAALHPQVEWHGTVGGMDEGRVAIGHTEVVQGFADYLAVWERMDMRAVAYIDAGGEEVVVFHHEVAKGRESGVVVESDSATVNTVRDGLIVRVRSYLTRDQALEAAGLEPATPADADALAAVFGAARAAAMPWLAVLHSAEEDRGFFTGVIADSDVLVVRRQGRPVAFIALGADLVAHLYVHPDHQRAGIGSALLDAAKALRPGGLRLWTFQRNKGARAFYEQRGFTEIDLTDGSANEEREPDVLLEWSPGSGTGPLAEF